MHRLHNFLCVQKFIVGCIKYKVSNNKCNCGCNTLMKFTCGQHNNKGNDNSEANFGISTTETVCSLGLIIN